MRPWVSQISWPVRTSVATVVRFCQDIGLRGFQDLKIRLAAELDEGEVFRLAVKPRLLALAAEGPTVLELPMTIDPPWEL